MGSYECLLQPSMLSTFSYLEIDMDGKLSHFGVQVPDCHIQINAQHIDAKNKSDINLFGHTL